LGLHSITLGNAQFWMHNAKIMTLSQAFAKLVIQVINSTLQKSVFRKLQNLSLMSFALNGKTIFAQNVHSAHTLVKAENAFSQIQAADQQTL
jgi:hypothetical protein